MMFLQELPSSEIPDVDPVDSQNLTEGRNTDKGLEIIYATERLRSEYLRQHALKRDRDNVARLAKVKTNNGIFLPPMQRLFPSAIFSLSKNDPLLGGDLLYKQAFQRKSISPDTDPQ
ncbi:hypothetical protein NPIL_691101 [Nephila pilipes]|uniref:Uncharacterized protein n=1 Tax=Nephila pilipes TaxID=299642 RepID=A0A8X6P6L5_NEPPI|nr:hypothetical protein NPIL_691101 [Nephila pilipes]